MAAALTRKFTNEWRRKNLAATGQPRPKYRTALVDSEMWFFLAKSSGVRVPAHARNPFPLSTPRYCERFLEIREHVFLDTCSENFLIRENSRTRRIHIIWDVWNLVLSGRNVYIMDLQTSCDELRFEEFRSLDERSRRSNVAVFPDIDDASFGPKINDCSIIS